MIESWILSKLEPLNGAPLILLRDPQRMIQRGARVVDGWAEQNGYTVLFCTGNLGLRDLYEPLRTAPDARVLVVDRSRKDSSQCLFYPDLEAQLGGQAPLELSLRDFLVEQTGDDTWPHFVEDRNLARLLLTNLPQAVAAHTQLRQVSANRFSDSDLYKIILGATLKINPFKKLTPSEIRRLCIEQHGSLEEVNRYLSPDVMTALKKMIESAPQPFCWLLERDPDVILLAFSLAAILRQHKLDYSLLLANLDPNLHEYRQMEPDFLDAALKDQLTTDPERVNADMKAVEDFLVQDPKRLAFLLRDRLELDQPEKAYEVLQKERLSPLIRSLALASLLVDLISGRDLKFHQKVLLLLEKQDQETTLPALQRPSEQWQMLRTAYRRGIELYRLVGKLARAARDLRVKPLEELDFADFDKLWNAERLNRLDFYISDLERMLRVADMLPLPHALLWSEMEVRWNKARQEFKETCEAAEAALNLVNRRFQDLYRRNYAQWILQADSPMVFTHQFLARMLKAHWDPKSGRKAVILVFDGMRTDAWDEFLRPVLEERYDVLETRPGSAILPSETEISRKAISAGCLPADFPIKSRSELELLRYWLQAEMKLSPAFEVVRDNDSVASGMAVRYVSPQIEYIVFSFTDKNLHGNPHDLAFIYNSIVREVIRQDVRAVLRELPQDALIFVTSDHGFTPFSEKALNVSGAVVEDNKLIKYRVVRAPQLFSGEDAKNVLSFDIKTLKIPLPDATRAGQAIQYIHFPRPGYVFQRETFQHNPDKYGHGGLSMAECFVPMAVLGSRHKEQGILSIAAVRQTGSVSEGEPLEIEVVVRAHLMLMQDLSITLSYNLKEVPTPRKEIFRGLEQIYRLRWTPSLPEITPEQRENGTLPLTVTAVLTYQYNGKQYRLSHSAELKIKLDTTRLRRRLDNKLDLLMGRVPKELKS